MYIDRPAQAQLTRCSTYYEAEQAIDWVDETSECVEPSVHRQRLSLKLPNASCI